MGNQNSKSESKTNFQSILWDNKIIQKFTSKQITIIDALKQNPFLEDLSSSEIKEIAKIAYEREFRTDEYIFRTGQPAAAMFIILSGKVRVVREGEGEINVELVRLHENETLGELALLDSSPRSASAIATKPSRLIAIFREDLNDFINSNPEVGSKILRKLAIITGYRLRITNDILIRKEEELKNCLEKKTDD